MKKSFLHITLFGALTAVSSCSRHTEQLQALADKLAELEERSDALKRDVIAQRKAVESVSSERERLLMARAETGKEVQKLLASMKSAEDDFATYKKDYRRAIQERAKGIELGDVSVQGSNEMLRSVVVSSATDTELTVLHTNGMARIALAKAPPHIQEMFAFDESLDSESADTKTQLDHAIRLGKKNLAVNKERLEKIARDSQRRFIAPTKSPDSDDRDPAWKKTSTFEGSYYAPLKGNSQNSSKPKTKTTSNVGKPL